jgi:hypothetical protein
MDKARPKVKEPSMAKDDLERQARLAEALRANLKRRKAQARAQGGAEPDATCRPVTPSKGENP